MHGAFRLLWSPRFVSCCLVAGVAGKPREAVWARLWESIKGWRRGAQAARPAVSDCTHPVPPGGPWLHGALLPVQQDSCSSSYDTPCLTLCAFCLGPVFGLVVGSVRELLVASILSGSLIEITVIIAPITMLLHRVRSLVQR